jgi:hypothetical protein
MKKDYVNGIAGIALVLAMALAACSQPTGGGGGGTTPPPAAPVETPAGHMTVDTGQTNVPVYTTTGVTTAQAQAMIPYLNAAYQYSKTNLNAKYARLHTKVKEIRIVPATGSNACESDGNGKFIIKLKSGLTQSQVEGAIYGMLNTDAISQIRQNDRDAVILAEKRSVAPATQVESPARDIVRMAMFPAPHTGRESGGAAQERPARRHIQA